MKLVNIPDGHHVIRHCKRRQTIRQRGEIVGVHPDLFFLRKDVGGRGPETYLSAVYLEFFSGTAEDRFRSCERSLSFRADGDDALVKICAATIRREGVKHKRALRVLHHTDKRSAPAYARIQGVPNDNDIDLAQALCESAVIEIVKVKALREE